MGLYSRIVPFWGISGHFPGWFPPRDFFLVSAASLWWPSRGKFVRRKYPDARTRMFLDSGGFTFFSKWAKYPFAPDDYLRLVEHPYYGYQPLLWASLDYPCEPQTRRRHGLMSNADRIEATLDHLAWFTEHATWPGMVPVVQGYTIPERLYCLEEMARRGLGARLMAIGSLCALKSQRTIDDVVTTLGAAAAELFPFRVQFHLFGVKLSYLNLQGARGLGHVFSLDTAAWELGDTGETRNARGTAEAKRRFFRYRDKVLPLLVRSSHLNTLSHDLMQLRLPLATTA
jgi:hypothetical protein